MKIKKGETVIIDRYSYTCTIFSICAFKIQYFTANYLWRRNIKVFCSTYAQALYIAFRHFALQYYCFCVKIVVHAFYFIPNGEYMYLPRQKFVFMSPNPVSYSFHNLRKSVFISTLLCII